MQTLTTRRLTVWYLVALGLIAALSIGSHLVLADTLHANEGSAAVINISGRQRMLSQRIATMALELQFGDETARVPLRTAIAQFSAAHQQLLQIASDPGSARQVAASLREAYHGSGDIDRKSSQFIAAAMRIADWPPVTPGIARRGQAFHATGHAAGENSTGLYPRDLATLVDLSRGPMLQGLEHVVAVHQAESEAKLERLKVIQWLILGVVLFTLVIEALFIFRPMIQRLTYHIKQLLDLADKDYLTGLANRRAFTHRALAEIERCRRRGRTMAMLVIDADHFKKINDTHGHLVGDAVLIGLVRSISDVARREDIVGRIGGEEFAILLPETSLAQAGIVAERIRAAVAQSPIDALGLSLTVTVSIGLANVPLDAADPLQAALLIADTMLYRAKDAGRNCVWPRLMITQKSA